MGRLHGRKGRLYVDISTDGTGSAEPVTFLNSWSIDFSVDNVEVTAFGDTNKTYVAGLPDAAGDFGGFYDDATSQLYHAAKGGEAREFYLYMTTDDTAEYFFGTALFDFSVSASVDGAVEVSGNWNAASEVKKIAT